MLKKTAKLKIMDLIAIRDHSEQELREKLQASYVPDEIDEAMTHARQQGWLASESEIADRLIESLQRQGKGLQAINAKLESKGLPPITGDHQQELEKALALAQTKVSATVGATGDLDEKGREKIGRFLISRGFEESIVKEVIYEKL